MKRLAARIALVTGGNTGIGRAVALAYADEGADVAACWIDREPEARTLMSAIQERGRRGLAVRADITQEADVVALVDRVERELGPLDVLVNNAGVQRRQGITEMSVADWDRMMNSTARRVPVLPRGGEPHDAAPARLDHQSLLAARLHRPRALHRLLRGERRGDRVHARPREGARAHGILVNGVAPGLVDTGFDPLRRR